jgi:hypothetical protein
MRAKLAKVRLEEPRAHELARRQEALVAEYLENARELEALSLLILDSNKLARELGEPKITSPVVTGGFMIRVDENAVRARLRELTTAAV